MAGNDSSGSNPFVVSSSFDSSLIGASNSGSSDTMIDDDGIVCCSVDVGGDLHDIGTPHTISRINSINRSKWIF